jgi:hypothetical protein
MQTLFEIGFVLVMLLPPAAVVVCGGAVLASSLSAYWRSHGRDRRIRERGPLAVHHPVGQ